MKHTLFRPLNAPLISLETDIGSRYFLIDTGCPTLCATHARFLKAGQWGNFKQKIRMIPFSLRPLSERLGVPIEGIIGIQELRMHGSFQMNFDQNVLILGEASQAESDEEVVISLIGSSQRPLLIRATIDSNVPNGSMTRDFYLDTGSRFALIPDEILPSRVNKACAQIGSISPHGFLHMALSADHQIDIEYSEKSPTSGAWASSMDGITIATLCDASKISLPCILGMEWLSRFNFTLCFERQELRLSPRVSSGVDPWECLTKNTFAPPFEVRLDPDEYLSNDRTFTLQPQQGSQLPDGLLPFTPYRLKDCTIPMGVEGINHLYNLLFGDQRKSLHLYSDTGIFDAERSLFFTG